MQLEEWLEFQKILLYPTPDSGLSPKNLTTLGMIDKVIDALKESAKKEKIIVMGQETLHLLCRSPPSNQKLEEEES